MMTREHRLLLATAATLPGVPARRARELAADGWEALDRNLAELPDDRRDAASDLAADLAKNGVDVVTSQDDRFPRRLRDLRKPPPFLFWWGNLSLADDRGIGMCGSRDASARGLQYARLFGRAVVERGLHVVSGYARGVDLETHLGALEAGGATIVVLAEGIKHFRRKRAFASLPFDEHHVLALSEFPPGQPWSAGAAMTRNATIAALARAMLVIEAREKGGTLNAGLRAMEVGRPVFAIDYSEDLPEGNRILFARGAVPLRSKNELLVALDTLAAQGEPQQLVLGEPK
jgi:DNA processing protein